MKPKDFEAALKAVSKLVAAVDAHAIASDLNKLAALLGDAKDKTAATSLKKMSSLKVVQKRDDGKKIEKVIQALEASHAVAELTAKATFPNLLSSLLDVLRANRDASLDDLLSTIMASHEKSAGAPAKKALVRTEIINRYNKRLEECLGDEGFGSAFKTLEQDEQITSAEMASLAKAFAGKKPKSRAKSLEAIWARHHAMMTFRSKSESRAGRSAA